MTIYVFHEYRDKAGIGSEATFTTMDEAIRYADNTWLSLAESDRQSYVKDSCGNFCVYRAELTPDELTAYTEGTADFTLEEKMVQYVKHYLP